jgi:chromosome segregation ATPase
MYQVLQADALVQIVGAGSNPEEIAARIQGLVDRVAQLEGYVQKDEEEMMALRAEASAEREKVRVLDIRREVLGSELDAAHRALEEERRNTGRLRHDLEVANKEREFTEEVIDSMVQGRGGGEGVVIEALQSRAEARERQIAALQEQRSRAHDNLREVLKEFCALRRAVCDREIRIKQLEEAGADSFPCVGNGGSGALLRRDPREGVG